MAPSLANFLRTLALPTEVERWSLKSGRARRVKTGAKVVSHGHHAIFQMAAVAVPSEMFGRFPARIAKLRLPAPITC